MAPKARWLTIDSKHRLSPGIHASLADFTVSATQAADPQLLFERSELSLYCLDHENQQAIFVELPPELDLTNASFVYMMQYDEATRVLAVPFDIFVELSEKLPAIGRFIMIYMTGRSGSTVLTRAFNALPGVRSLSEPDTPVSLVHHWPATGRRRSALQALLDASLRFLFWTPTNGMPAVSVLKLRNESIRIAELFETTVPQAKNLFSYRDAVGFVGSFYRIFKRIGRPEYEHLSETIAWQREYFNRDITLLTTYLGDVGETIPITWGFTLWWLSIMEGYLSEYKRGFTMLPVRFEELTNHREKVLDRVLTYCDLGDLETSDALRAFSTDAHEETPLAQESVGEEKWRLSEKQVAEIEAILARHPVITTPDFKVPGTPTGI